jgi:hypothetical protein
MHLQTYWPPSVPYWVQSTDVDGAFVNGNAESHKGTESASQARPVKQRLSIIDDSGTVHHTDAPILPVKTLLSRLH